MAKIPSFPEQLTLLDLRSIKEQSVPYESVSDLVEVHSLRGVFKEIYYHLYSNSNLPRAERLVAEMTRLLFCKIYDEMYNTEQQFKVKDGESSVEVAERTRSLFNQVKQEYMDVFGDYEILHLDDESITYVVETLQDYSLLETDKDSVGDAFEVFLGPSLRGEKGQFFTPRNVVRMMVEFLDPDIGERVMDPACGSGGFLIVTLEHIWKKIESRCIAGELSPREARQQRLNTVSQNIFGIDKEADLAKVARAYMAIVGGGKGNIFSTDSLDPMTWSDRRDQGLCQESFDVVLTNPPFGSKIPIRDKLVLAQYDLGYKWEFDRRGTWVKTSKVADKEDPQTLFIELCIKLLKPGGRMGIIIPEGIFGNRSGGYILDYIRSQGKIIGIVDCIRTLFQPSTDTKTNILFFQRGHEEIGKDRGIFLSVVRKCGHDRRGRPLYKDDGSLNDELPTVIQHYHQSGTTESRLGFWRQPEDLDSYYLIPRYYDPEVEREMRWYEETGNHELKTIEQLIKEGVLSVRKGHEVGSAAYGTGDIPFIRTSDLANWEIKREPTNSISEEIYEEYQGKQNLQIGDILLVNDGRYKIGKTCMLTEHDTRIVVQSHFRIIRVLRKEVIDPYMLLHLLKSPFVQHQIQSKTIIQSTIETLGSRIREVVLPIPKDPRLYAEIREKVRRIVTRRAELLTEAMEINGVFDEEY